MTLDQLLRPSLTPASPAPATPPTADGGRSIPFGKPMIGEEERAAVLEVLAGTQLVHGPRAKSFEADFAAFAGGGHATSLGSCTAGLHLAYFHFGIGPGDEVIVPAMTHVATAHAVEYVGATPVFVDADPATGNIDLDALESAITPRTRAISLVHFLGLPVDMRRVMALSVRHDLKVVEDCALAVGGSLDGTHCGLFGDVGLFSFYPVKHMTTGEGGMALSRHPDLIAAFERKKAFGVDRTVAERKVPGVYDVTMLGFNYRMNEMAAAIGIEQLKRVPDFLTIRAENAAVLRSLLSDIDEIAVLADGDRSFVHANYCVSVVLADEIAPRRVAIMERLAATGVGVSIYYPRAVPLMSYYAEKYRVPAAQVRHAQRIADQSIALPVGAHLDGDDMAYVAEALKRAIAEETR